MSNTPPDGSLPIGLLTGPSSPPARRGETAFRPNREVNRVLEGDCLDRLNEVPDASVHLILCDLPYGTTRNRWDSVIPIEPFWDAYRRILAPKGAVVLSGQGPFTARLMTSNEDWFRYKLYGSNPRRPTS